ncbi:amino acid permease, theoretically lysine-specific [Atractiella rhizophila]|nr:amino acid permease, theoretically lysine-specific [Atractiella rhizophila]
MAEKDLAHDGKEVDDKESLSLDAAPLDVEALPEEDKAHGAKKWLGDNNNGTVRGMHSRHLTFIAIGGTIGTGIFLSVGSSVATAGPGGALIAYFIVGLFVYGVVMLLGEMSSLIPVSGAFSVFGSRFVSPALGATLGWNYAIQWAFSIPSELVAASIILQYWTDKLKTWEWSLIIVIPVFAVQMINVRAFGETEYWLALIKVILVVMFIIVGLIYDWGGVVGHPGPGLSNFNDGPFAGKFAGLAQSFTFAFYSFGGTELVALAAGESKEPHKSVPRAIKATFFRILLFYILTVLVIGLCINRNDPTLFAAYDDSDVAASPITIVFKQAGFGAAVHVVNAVLLTAVLSATNSCFYASSRMLLSLAQEKKAPKLLGYTTKRGVPVVGLLVILAVSFLTFLTTIWGEGVVFTWFLNVTGMSALLTWISIAVISLRFHYAFKFQGRDKDDLPFRVPFGASTPLALLVITLGLCMFAAQNWAATTYDDGKLAQDIIAVDIGLVLFFGIGLIFAIHQKITRPDEPLLVPLEDCDFETHAVWGKGGGKVIRENERRQKEEDISKGKRRRWFHWREIRKSIY